MDVDIFIRAVGRPDRILAEEPVDVGVVVSGAEVAPLLSGHSPLWKLSPCWIVELIGNEHFGQLFRYNWHPL